MPYSEEDKAKFAQFGITEEPVTAPNSPAPVEPKAPDVEASQVPAPAAPPARELPEKLRGKTADEIAEMYLNLEQTHGKVAREYGQTKEQVDELLNRMRQYESGQRQQSQTKQDPQSPEDLKALFDKEAAQNPSEAIFNLIQRATGRVAGQVEAVQVGVKQELARDYVQRNLRDNPDFKENFDTMVKEEQSLPQDFVNPKYAGTPLAFNLLHRLAREANMSRYEERAVARTRSQASQIRDEKKAAFSESTASAPSASDIKKDPMTMDLDELAASLPRVSIYRD